MDVVIRARSAYGASPAILIGARRRPEARIFMGDKTAGLLQRIHEAERDLDRAVAEWRREAKKTKASAVRFSKQIRAEQRKLRKSLVAHIRGIGILFWLTTPVIYAMIIPLVLADIFATLYQLICFPVYGIARIQRSDYVVIDRHRLSYLNAIEKLNCVYCGYANGVIAYARELASRTEQYFCPIKHALSVSGPHNRYSRFVDYGDAKAYRDQLEHLQKTAGDP
jgi:hypothetical protein